MFYKRGVKWGTGWMIRTDPNVVSVASHSPLMRHTMIKVRRVQRPCPSPPKTSPPAMLRAAADTILLNIWYVDPGTWRLCGC